MSHFIIFVAFTILSIIFRFAIGNPVTSSRFQTKYKYKSIPVVLNFILFFNVSNKPIAIHIIIFQLQNYIVSLVSFLAKKTVDDRIHFTVECYLGFAIVILPLFIETVVDMMRGMVWKTEDNKVELSFEECQIKFVLNNQLYVLLFGTYIGNQIVFFNKKNEIIGEGIINYKKK